MKGISLVKLNRTYITLLHIGIDEFVRDEDGSGNDEDGSGNDEVVSFFLQAEYQNSSEEARKHVKGIVTKNCDLVDDKYILRTACAGIVVSL